MGFSKGMVEKSKLARKEGSIATRAVAERPAVRRLMLGDHETSIAIRGAVVKRLREPNKNNFIADRSYALISN